MNIQDLPSEILEKILVEGNFLTISRVCQTWRDHAQIKKIQFNEVFFDLTKDDPEKTEKKNPNQLFVFNSPLFDKNGIRVGPEIITVRKYKYIKEYSFYLKDKYKKIFNKITFANTFNFIYDPLLYVDIYKIPNYTKKYILSDNVFADNEDCKIIGVINHFSSYLEDYLYMIKNKIKNVNIEIKDVCDRIENIDPDLFFNLEIDKIKNIINYRLFEHFKKFTFEAPNNTYLIYDENKKLLIIRFGNYEKYNFPMEKISICKEECRYFDDCFNHRRYYINSFELVNSKFVLNYYPARLFEYKYEKLTERVEKLIIISSEFHDFMFDRLLKHSEKEKEKEIKYYCLDPNKVKVERENFEFVPVEKENEHEYSFEQIHFKYFGEKSDTLKFFF